MEKRYYRSIYDELDDMRNYLDTLSQLMEKPQKVALLPYIGEQPKMLPSIRGELKVDVNENESEVMVTMEILEGIVKKDISIDLINPHLLEISGERREETIKERDGYYMTERRFGSMTRVIPLPCPVTEEGSVALFRNGILMIHLKKETKRPVAKIIIE